ncbi:hypothetical protein D1831_03855 [Lactiplantibacillus garii]|uniref:Uncharacterized protein n=1 Tax=Lactiplantibacillus garii TaxID=2306423 RepID=A0A3R8KMH7_9LACO|nr:DsrE family protein [Lactiplantibacillus garii]RRK11088.1 hypothetical protein D1831_03855 [Lactiplantibacillus garii]
MSKLVVHVDEPAKVGMAIGNVRNFLALRAMSTVVIVVNGPAITTLADGKWAPLLTTLPQVELDACHNAMASHQLTAADLPAGVTVVPAGVVRLVELQEQGYAYLKP